MKAGKNNFSLSNEKGTEKIYAKGTLITKSFHHDKGERINPVATSKTLII